MHWNVRPAVPVISNINFKPTRKILSIFNIKFLCCQKLFLIFFNEKRLHTKIYIAISLHGNAVSCQYFQSFFRTQNSTSNTFDYILIEISWTRICLTLVHESKWKKNKHCQLRTILSLFKFFNSFVSFFFYFKKLFMKLA